MLAECDRYDPNNTEFTISLLDCRYLAGDRDLFRRLHDKVIPKLVMRESKALLQGLAEVTRERHAKHGMTLYHLGAKSEGSSRRTARLQRGQLAGADLRDGQAARLARCEFAAGSGAQATGGGAGFPDVGAMLSAFPAWAR